MPLIDRWKDKSCFSKVITKLQGWKFIRIVHDDNGYLYVALTEKIDELEYTKGSVDYGEEFESSNTHYTSK